MVKPTNVTRYLDARKIDYHAYELPGEKFGAVETACLLGVDPAVVFKTIVIKRVGRGKPVLAVVPGAKQVDLKKVAVYLGEKKVSLPSEREAERLTGLQSGGISPLALLKRGFQVVMDASIHDFQAVHISGGQRGLNIKLPVQDLICLTNAKTADILR
jgi:Cys-tRNA(Pro)/Cys-tRNA(Cys) deacylase